MEFCWFVFHFNLAKAAPDALPQTNQAKYNLKVITNHVVMVKAVKSLVN